MLQQTPKELRVLILQTFTNELIKDSKTHETIEFENALQTQIKEKLKEHIGIIEPDIAEQKRGTKQISPKIINTPKKIPIIPRQQIQFPKQILPPTVRYLRPKPTQKEIDLEKLNPIIKDPTVSIIECNGPDSNLIVKGKIGTKVTKILLSKDEINQIIEKFSKATKIPVQQGVFKVVFGKLIFSAIVSDTIGSKFIIEKMTYNAGFR